MVVWFGIKKQWLLMALDLQKIDISKAPKGPNAALP